MGDALPERPFAAETRVVKGHASPAVAGRDLGRDASQVVSEDPVVGGQADGLLQGRGIDELFAPVEAGGAVPASPQLNPKLAHWASRRNHTEPSGGTVTVARAGKWLHGSATASTAPRLPYCPEPS